MKEKLTDKQEKFVQLMIKGKSQRAAYKAAYGCKNWKNSNIDSAASKCLKIPKVLTRYNELKLKVVSKTEYTSVSMRKMIVDTEIAIATADLGKLYEFTTDEEGYITAKAGDLDALDTRAIQEVKFDRYGRLMLKLYDKQAAISALREMYNITAEEKEKTGIRIELPAEIEEIDV